MIQIIPTKVQGKEYFWNDYNLHGFFYFPEYTYVKAPRILIKSSAFQWAEHSKYSLDVS